MKNPLLSAALLLALPALSQSVPSTLNYQGRLTDNTPQQNPLTATVNMSFELWDCASCGTPAPDRLWIEPAAGTIPVTVTGGIFNLTLGGNGVALPAAVFSGGIQRYLQIYVNGEALSPRQALTATGYADQADNAATATSASTAATATNALQLGGLPASGYQLSTALTCASGQFLKAIGNGSAACASPPSNNLSSPVYLSGNAPSAVLTVNSASIYGTGISVTSDGGAGITVDTHGGGKGVDASSGAVGVKGASLGTDGIGVQGYSAGGASGYGVWGDSWPGTGVLGTSAQGTGVSGYSGSGDAVYGYTGYGYAGYFQGNVSVVGTLSKSAGSFKIDHPLDPANKYLYHSFVESPDMKNIYDGTVVMDKNGEAAVDLPGWFGALNRDFRYQLTAIGGPGPNLHVKVKITGNRFVIAGGPPGLEVSWQVTGIRRDAYAEAHRIPVEQEKPAAERGTFLHPAEQGQPAEKALGREQRGGGH